MAQVWTMVNGKPIIKDTMSANTYTPEQLKAMFDKNPQSAEQIAKAFGFNSASEALSSANNPIPEIPSASAQTALANTIAANNPSASSAVNAGANPRRTDLDSAIVPYIQLGRVDPTTGKNSYNEEVARAEAEIKNPTGMSAQNEAAEMIKKAAGASDLERQFQKYLSENVSNEGVQKYGSNLYGRAMAEFERAAQLDREKNAADLAARGLGMSTVVNDVNSAVDRDLSTNRQKSFYDSNTAAQNYIAQLMQQGIGMENNIGNRGIEAGNTLSGVGINQANIYGGASNRLNALNQQSEANALLNYGLQDAANDKSVANVKYLLNLPFATNEAGTQASSNATSASNTQYQGLMNAYNTQQEGISKLLGGVLTNALGKK